MVTVNQRRIKEKRIGVRLDKMIAEYLNRRKTYVTYGEMRVEKNIEKRCLQGSVLGPIVWNITMDSLLN